MNLFELTLTNGRTIRVSASNCHQAIQAACQSENAPVEAVAHWRVVSAKD